MIALFSVLLVLQVFIFTLPVHAAQRPNIVFVLTDDQAAWTLESLGNSQSHTPNLDRFFGQSCVLQNCFVTTPVCSPSRASLFTSRYGTELGITDWINPKEEPEVGLNPDFASWPSSLRASGYETCLVGKWHLGTAPRFHPKYHGFSSFRGFLAGGAGLENPVLMIDDATREFQGLTDDVLTTLALEYLQQDHRAEPFLLCVHYRAPHAPWTPVREEDSAPFKGMDPIIPNPLFPGLDTEKVKGKTLEYLANVTGVDRNIGQILSVLDQQGLARNTVVVFTSDNGYNLGHNGIWHKGNGHWITLEARGHEGEVRFQRPNMYDHSLRVPSAIRLPSQAPEGKTISQTIDSLDWFPTLLDIAGVPNPATAVVRGRSFLPLLRGEDVEWDNDLYAEYSQHHYTSADLRMYRTPEWKLIRDFRNPGKDELYHLTADPAESNNRIGEPSCETIKGELNRKLLGKLMELGDPLGLGTEPPRNPASSAPPGRVESRLGPGPVPNH